MRQQQALLARPVMGGLSSRNFGNAQVGREGGREGKEGGEGGRARRDERRGRWERCGARGKEARRRRAGAGIRKRMEARKKESGGKDGRREGGVCASLQFFSSHSHVHTHTSHLNNNRHFWTRRRWRTECSRWSRTLRR